MGTNQFSENSYEITVDELKDLIINALINTIMELTPEIINSNDGKNNKLKSQSWVKHLALQLQEHYKKDNLVSFFNQRGTSRTSSLKDTKEFLFDITVAKVIPIPDSSLEFISNPVWQIESEFANLLNETIKDFQKLLSGNAPNKMMIGPLNTKGDTSRFREITKVPASSISGDLFYLFITHPRYWVFAKEIKWKLYKWRDWDWFQLI